MAWRPNRRGSSCGQPWPAAWRSGPRTSGFGRSARRAVLAWREGEFRPRTKSVAIDYRDIQDVQVSERVFGAYAVPRTVIAFAAAGQRYEIVLYSEITDDQAVELLLTALRAAVVPS